MASLNLIPNCGTGSGNLGVPLCSIEPGLIVGAIALPKGTVWTAADITALQATIQAATTNNTYLSRAQIMGQFLEIDDQSEDEQRKSYGYGSSIITRDAKYIWSFPYLDGGFCRHRNMLKFKGRQGQYEFVFIDNNGVLWGTTATTTSGLPGFKGISITQLWVKNWKPATGSDPAMYVVEFSIANGRQLNEDAAYITDLDFDVFTDITMVQDINFNFVDATTVDSDGDIKLSLSTGCGGQNLVEAFPTEVVNAARYTVVNTVTGAAIAFAVAAGGTGNGSYLAFNLDDTDADYPAPGGTVTISAVNPAAWVALGLDPYEALPISIIVT